MDYKKLPQEQKKTTVILLDAILKVHFLVDVF